MVKSNTLEIHTYMFEYHRRSSRCIHRQFPMLVYVPGTGIVLNERGFSLTNVWKNSHIVVTVEQLISQAQSMVLSIVCLSHRYRCSPPRESPELLIDLRLSRHCQFDNSSFRVFITVGWCGIFVWCTVFSKPLSRFPDSAVEGYLLAEFQFHRLGYGCSWRCSQCPLDSVLNVHLRNLQGF